MPAPPVGRPPGPPVSNLPKRTTTCFEAYGDRDLSGFLTAVRDVLRREWDRNRGAPPADLPQQELFLSEVISAMLAGKVVPGFYRNLEASCFMDWSELACWARWYAVLPDEAGRAFVLDAMASGDLRPWLQQSEYDWPAPPDQCDPAAPADPTGPCCPRDVWGDPLYAVGQGQYPGDKPVGSAAGKNTGIIVAVGVAAIIGIAALVIVGTRDS